MESFLTLKQTSEPLSQAILQAMTLFLSRSWEELLFNMLFLLTQEPVHSPLSSAEVTMWLWWVTISQLNLLHGIVVWGYAGYSLPPWALWMSMQQMKKHKYLVVNNLLHLYSGVYLRALDSLGGALPPSFFFSFCDCPTPDNFGQYMNTLKKTNHNHGILLDLLQGLGGIVLCWFVSFLQGQSQLVLIGSEKSSPQLLFCALLRARYSFHSTWSRWVK